MQIDREHAAFALAFLATLAGYLKLWVSMRSAKRERSAMELELRSQIAKLEARIKICEDRWHEWYTQGK